MATGQTVERYCEEVPYRDWVISAQSPHGEKEWYACIQISGQFVRRKGPFKTREEAANEYNRTIRHILEWADDHRGDCFVFHDDHLSSAYLRQKVRP